MKGKRWLPASETRATGGCHTKYPFHSGELWPVWKLNFGAASQFKGKRMPKDQGWGSVQQQCLVCPSLPGMGSRESSGLEEMLGAVWMRWGMGSQPMASSEEASLLSKLTGMAAVGSL